MSEQPAPEVSVRREDQRAMPVAEGIEFDSLDRPLRHRVRFRQLSAGHRP